MKIKNEYEKTIRTPDRRMDLVYKSILVGIVVSFVTILYRLALSNAERLSLLIYSYIGQRPVLILPLFIILGILGWAIGRLVRKYPMISGSGIPQVNGQLQGYFKNPWLSTLIAKFIGGSLTVLAGLSVGREGPSIQLGAAAAHGLGNKIAATRTERKVLIASGASAGLASAFNAPLAGVMFALEEIFKYFSPIVLLATITSAVTADYISKLFFGIQPIFQFPLNGSIPLRYYWLIAILGIVVGIAGAFYNTILLKTMALYKHLSSFNIHLKSILPFLIAGIAGLTFPIVLGGGGHIIAALDSSRSLQWLFLVLIIKFLFSMASFGSGVPGGIFFPLLVLGSLIGAIFGHSAVNALGLDPELFYNFVILAMAGFFTAIVRAPITGVVLLTEMTGSFNHLLPLTAVSVIAYVTADLLKSSPIYESLLDLQLKDRGIFKDEEGDLSKITLEMVVHHGSEIENRRIRELGLPAGTLVIAVSRNGMDITPNGFTKILAADHLIVLTSVNEEAHIRELLKKATGNS